MLLGSGGGNKSPNSPGQAKTPYFDPVWSDKYGGGGGQAVHGECNYGDYIDYMQLWHGDKNLDGMYASCRNPRTGDFYDLTKSPDGKKQYIGRVDAKPNFWTKLKSVLSILLPMVPASIPVIGDKGGSLIDQLPDNSGRPYPVLDLYSPRGITRVDVYTDGNEVRGTQLYSPEGRSSGLAGGTAGGVRTFACKNRQVLTGYDGRSGDRVDQIKFKCSTVAGRG